MTRHDIVYIGKRRFYITWVYSPGVSGGDIEEAEVLHMIDLKTLLPEEPGTCPDIPARLISMEKKRLDDEMPDLLF